jgi:hypothetical protein
MINLGSFLASHKSKMFLAMRGTAAPFKPPKQKGAHPPFFKYVLSNLFEEKLLF